MEAEWAYLPVRTVDPDRIAFSRKRVTELTDLDKEYQQKHATLGPRPDIELDGSIEYKNWLARSAVVIREYLDKL